MKPISHRVAIIYLVLVAAILVLIGLKLTIWSAPSVVISTVGSDVVVDSSFLGEYHLGLERIRVTTESGDEVVVDLRDPAGELPNVFRLTRGTNTVERRGEANTFVLDAGRRYVLTLCGDNGWGWTRCRSRSLVVPAG